MMKSRYKIENPLKDKISLYYSSDPNKRAGPNKRTGWNFEKNQLRVQGRVEF